MSIDQVKAWIEREFPRGGQGTIIWPTDKGLAVKRPGAAWEWIDGESPAVATGQPATDEHCHPGTRARTDTPDRPGVTEGDEQRQGDRP